MKNKMEHLISTGKIFFGKESASIDCACVNLNDISYMNSKKEDIRVAVKFIEQENKKVLEKIGTKDFLEMQFYLETGIRKFQCAEALCYDYHHNCLLKEYCILLFKIYSKDIEEMKIVIPPKKTFWELLEI